MACKSNKNCTTKLGRNTQAHTHPLNVTLVNCTNLNKYLDIRKYFVTQNSSLVK